MLVSVKDVVRAKKVITPYVHHTPISHSNTFSKMSGVNFYMKCENFQKTGSFKIRGGLNNLFALTAEQRKNGVVTPSSGNHAQGVAYAAQLLGARCTVCMGDWSSPAKIAACKGYGAEVKLIDGDAGEVHNEAKRLHEAHGYEFISVDSVLTIAGHGTIGLEILRDLPEVNAIVTPISSGGLISGIATAVKQLCPDVKIYGVQPEHSAAMKAALDTGHPVQVKCDTCCDGLTATNVTEFPLEIVKRYVDDVITVPERETRRAVAQALQYTKMLVEPSSAITIAAILNDRLPVKGNVVAVLTGGNLSTESLSEILTETSSDPV